MATTPDVFEDWMPGDPAYTAEKVARNFRAIRGEFARLFATGGRDAIVEIVQDKRALVFKTSAGAALTGVTLPLAAVTPKGERVVGRRYDEGDLFRVEGSSYVVKKDDYVATEDFAADAAGNWFTLHAAKGDDAEIYLGEYVPGQAYARRSLVYVGDINQGGVMGVSFWRAFQDIPADGPEPGEFPWGRISAEPAIPAKPSLLPISLLGAIPGGGAVLWHATLGLAGQLPAALAGSAFRLLTATTSELVLTLRKKGNGGVTPTGSPVATITFPAGGTVGALAVTAAGGLVSLIPGDTLVLTGPAAADATAADLAASLAYSQT
ncbi:hypothetical protein [Methylorubrum sp. DB1722]|uniref:hypothetical protein n=1 Tax=Methylorubrum sp. DB1722 TaxID=2478916 RepID=UPI0018E39A93|nr:hypothetical protein [Methylorubrum sp. DB1722]MBI1689538.1 hypothetical protein [Methylorubrum sp. DB1722]